MGQLQGGAEVIARDPGCVQLAFLHGSRGARRDRRSWAVGAAHMRVMAGAPTAS